MSNVVPFTRVGDQINRWNVCCNFCESRQFKLVSPTETVEDFRVECSNCGVELYDLKVFRNE